MTTNKLMQKLQDKIQSTDQVYTGKLAALKGLIENQLARIGNIRDSFGNKFTTEACGVVYFGSSTGSILNNPTNFPSSWGTVATILARPAEQITDLQFEHLAWFFTLQTTIEGQERFLNLFAEPVTPPNARNPYGVNAFAICPQKVGGVQWFIDAGIRAILDAQMGLSTNSAEYEALQGASDHLKRSYALLSVINSLTGLVTIRGSEITPSIGVQQNVILTIGDTPPITLTEDRQRVSVTFTRGEVYGFIANQYSRSNQFGVGIRPVNTTIPRGWEGEAHSSLINPSSKFINNVHSEGLERGIIRALGNHFYVQHQFDMNTFAIRQVAGIARGIATAGLGNAASTAAGVIAGLPTARNDARRVQNDFIAMTDGTLFGTFQRDFAFRGVVITSTDQPPQVLNWPTVYTSLSLDALNRVLMDNRHDLKHITCDDMTHVTCNDPADVITQLFFTREQFWQNPNIVFDVYAALNDAGMGYLIPLINANRIARNRRIEDPSSLPPLESLQSDDKEI